MSDEDKKDLEPEEEEEELDIEALLESMNQYVEGEHKNAIKASRLDLMAFEDIFEMSPELKNLVARNHEKLETSQKLLEDLFNSLYKYDPQIRDEEEMEFPYRLNRAMVKGSVESARYEELRLQTRFNEYLSALAAREITEELVSQISDMEELNEHIKQQMQNQQDIQRAMNILQGIDELTQPLKDTDVYPDPKAGGATVGQVKQAMAKAAQQALNQAQQQAQAGHQMADLNAGDIGRAMSQAMKKAQDGVNDFNDMCGGWGVEPGQFTKMTYKDKAALAQLMQESDFLKKVAKLAGRMKRIAFQKRREKVKYARQEIASIGLGNDLASVLPSELMALAVPEMEPLFMKKYVSRELQQYERKSKEKLGQGPIICCVDESGSMDHNKLLWAKGIALALANVAMKEKRHFLGISFSTKHNECYIDPTDTVNRRLAILKQFITSNLGGGTNFQQPLQEALNHLVRNMNLKKGDIIFITDGQNQLPQSFLDHFNRRKGELQFSVQTILVGDAAQYRKWVEPFSDQIHTIHDVMGDVRGGFKRSKEIFKNLA